MNEAGEGEVLNQFSVSKCSPSASAVVRNNQLAF